MPALGDALAAPVAKVDPKKEGICKTPPDPLEFLVKLERGLKALLPKASNRNSATLLASIEQDLKSIKQTRAKILRSPQVSALKALQKKFDSLPESQRFEAARSLRYEAGVLRLKILESRDFKEIWLNMDGFLEKFLLVQADEQTRSEYLRKKACMDEPPF